jgi:ABC-type uncharacterized transport system permease subunit
MDISIKAKFLNLVRSLYFPLVAIAASLLIGSIVIVTTSSASPLEAYKHMFNGAFGSLRSFDETLLKSIPFIFTALSYAMAKRCGIINLGAEGQFAIGALLATITGVSFPNLPTIVHLPLTLIAGFVGGALFGLIPAVLKVSFGASELITTIMLNYIAKQVISYFVNGPIMDSASSSYPQSAPIPESAVLTRIIPGLRVHYGLILALLAVIFYYVYLWKTKGGYELRVVGLNPNAGLYAGMNIKASILRSMLLAGGFAGLGGCIEIIAVQNRLMMTSFAVSYGFTGIAVALLGSNNPIGILISGLLFGGLQAGSLRMQTMTDASSSVVLVVQALVILFIAGRLMFRLKSGRHLTKETLAVPPQAMDEKGAQL